MKELRESCNDEAEKQNKIETEMRRTKDCVEVATKKEGTKEPRIHNK